MNTLCNDKIRDLPPDFAGAFMLEESYYTTNGKTHPSHSTSSCSPKSRRASA